MLSPNLRPYLSLLDAVKALMLTFSMKNQTIDSSELFLEGKWSAHSHFLMANDSVRGGIPYPEWSDMCRMIANIDRMMVVYQNLLVEERRRATQGIVIKIAEQKEKILQAFKLLNDFVFIAKLSHIRTR